MSRLDHRPGQGSVRTADPAFERMEAQEREESIEFLCKKGELEDAIRDWPYKRLMDELLKVPTQKRLATHSKLLSALQDAAAELAKEQINA